MKNKGDMIRLIVLIIWTVSMLMASCSKYDNYRCYAVGYIEVEGDRIMVSERPTGAWSDPKEGITHEHNGEMYRVTEYFECF